MTVARVRAARTYGSFVDHVDRLPRESFFDPLIRTLEGLLGHVPHALLRFRPDVSAVEAVRRDLSLG